MKYYNFSFAIAVIGLVFGAENEGEQDGLFGPKQEFKYDMVLIGDKISFSPIFSHNTRGKDKRDCRRIGKLLTKKSLNGESNYSITTSEKKYNKNTSMLKFAYKPTPKVLEEFGSIRLYEYDEKDQQVSNAFRFLCKELEKIKVDNEGFEINIPKNSSEIESGFAQLHARQLMHRLGKIGVKYNILEQEYLENIDQKLEVYQKKSTLKQKTERVNQEKLQVDLMERLGLAQELEQKIAEANEIEKEEFINQLRRLLSEPVFTTLSLSSSNLNFLDAEKSASFSGAFGETAAQDSAQGQSQCSEAQVQPQQIPAPPANPILEEDARKKKVPEKRHGKDTSKEGSRWSKKVVAHSVITAVGVVAATAIALYDWLFSKPSEKEVIVSEVNPDEESDIIVSPSVIEIGA